MESPYFFFYQCPIFQLSDFHDSAVSQLQQPPASLPNEPWTEVFISLIWQCRALISAGTGEAQVFPDIPSAHNAVPRRLG